MVDAGLNLRIELCSDKEIHYPTAHFPNQVSLVTAAAACNQVDVLEFLSSKGIDLGKADRHGWIAATTAAACGNIDVLELLRSKDVDIGKNDGNGWIVSTMAGRKGQVDVLRYLAETGFDLKMKDKYGRLPMGSAIKYNDEIRGEIRAIVEHAAMSAAPDAGQPG